MKIADLHCDFLSLQQKKIRQGFQYSLGKNQHHLDLERMRQGNYLLQNFAVFTDVQSSSNPYQDAQREIELFHAAMKQYSDQIAPVFSYQDVLTNQEGGKISALLSIEDAGCCQGRIGELQKFYRQGVRIMSLTWNYENELAFPNIVPENAEKKQCKIDNRHGLKPLGIEFLHEMERLGIIVDVSHLSDAGFWDVAHTVKGPFIASHSNARAVCGHVRNLTDDMLKAIADHGGVTGINYYPDFLDPEESKYKCQGSLDWMLRHIRHIRKIAGIEMIALGSDFDGFEEIPEINDCSKVQMLADALQASGFHSSEIEQIFHKNVLRVIREFF